MSTVKEHESRGVKRMNRDPTTQEGARPMTEYLTTAEVGEKLRTPLETVRYWRHVGKGPKSFKVGRRVLYAREDVEAFLAEARTSAA